MLEDCTCVIQTVVCELFHQRKKYTWSFVFWYRECLQSCAPPTPGLSWPHLFASRWAPLLLCLVWSENSTLIDISHVRHTATGCTGAWGEHGTAVQDGEPTKGCWSRWKVHRKCAFELAGVSTKIYKLSLAHATIPICLKPTVIIPVHKKSIILGLYNCWPFALTPQKLPLSHLWHPSICLQGEQVINITLYTALQHLEHRGSMCGCY